NIDIRKGLMTFEYNDQKGKVPIKFIHGDRGEPIFDETTSEEDESEEDSESEFEKQYLEKKTFLMWQHDDWDTVTPRQQEFQDDDSVEIITKEAWTPIATPKRNLRDVDFGDIPSQIIRSVKWTYEVQAYQEGIKIKWKKYTWKDFKRLDKKFTQSCNWNN
ncbi:19408_t:CDS:1, partial [Racocetra fulgida]